MPRSQLGIETWFSILCISSITSLGVGEGPNRGTQQLEAMLLALASLLIAIPNLLSLLGSRGMHFLL